MRHVLLGTACIAVLCIILNLGLWPFHAPRNEVNWLKDGNGLRFGDYGTVVSTGTFKGAGPSNGPFCSIEIWLERASNGNSGTILAFYAPGHPVRLSLHQSLTDFVLQRGTARATRFYVDNVFRQPRPVLVTITSGLQGTAVYVNGTLATMPQHFRLGASDCAGRLILGDSPLQPDSWRGQVRGLALYCSKLQPSTVLRHYQAWTKNGRPEAARNERNVGLYLFNERSGNLVHNHAASSLDLEIPETYTVLDKVFLEPFWDEFHMSRSYWASVLKNIVGFIPLGFCFCAYFSVVRHAKHAQLITVILGLAVSLTIEVLQGFLPTRDSGTTDLFTNTLGTYVGVLAYRAVSRILFERLPWLAPRRVPKSDPMNMA